MSNAGLPGLRKTPLALAVLMFSSCSLPALAAATDESAPASARLPEVRVQAQAIDGGDYNSGVSTVGSKGGAAAVRDIPQAVTVIDRAVLDSQAATTLVQALRNVPGITISAGEGGQIGNNINLRGFSARTDLYLDGFRDRGQYTRDTFALEAVEVLEGPSSLLFGRGSTGGVINQVGKRPQLQPIGEISASVGSDGYYRGTVDVGNRLSEDSAFRIAAMGQSIDSTRDVAKMRDWGVAPSLRFGIGTPTEITLGWLSQHNDDLPDYGTPLIRFQGQTVATPIKARRDNFYGFTDDQFGQDVNALSAVVQHKFSPNLSVRNATQYSLYRVAAAPTPLGGLVDPVTGAAINSITVSPNTPLDQLYAIRQQRDRAIRDSSLFNQTDLTAKLRLGPVLNTVATGIEVGRDEYRNDSYNRLNAGTTPSSTNISPMPPVNLGAPQYGDKPAVTGNLLRLRTQFTETNADTFAVYVNDQIDFTPQWKLVAGLRWDQFKADQNQLTYTYATPISASAPSATITQAGLAHGDYNFSTRAGLIFQPDAAQSYYFSYGTSFNPSAETVTLTATQASLDPEKNRSFEVGSKWDWFGGDLSVSTALFRIEKTNARTTDAGTGVVTLDGDVRVEGVELKAIGKLMPAWQLIGGYTWLDGKILDSIDSINIGTTQAPVTVFATGKTPQNTPRNSASLWTTYTLYSAWQLGGGLLFASDRWVNNTDTAQIDGYVRLDATAAWVQKAYELRLNLQNLTDRHYYEAASAGRATAVDGRRLIVSGTWRFL